MDVVKGPSIEAGTTLGRFVKSFKNVGIQATSIYRAAEILREMIEDEESTNYLAFTSNMGTSGVRDVITTIVSKRWFHLIVTTIGAVEEDIMKTFGEFYIADWNIDDAELKKKGYNRVGNILIPNDRYEELEKFLYRVFDSLSEKGTVSPVELVREIGKHIKDDSSFVRQAYINGVPVFVPAPTDGALGLMLYFYREYTGRELSIDVTGDMNLLAEITYNAKRTGAFIIGGSVPKHHVIGMNIVRGGLDRAVYVTTAAEWDASLSGARPSEAVSWGKLKEKSPHVHVYVEASVAVPLIVGAVLEWTG